MLLILIKYIFRYYIFLINKDNNMFKKKIMKSLYICTILSVLTACGGSGGRTESAIDTLSESSNISQTLIPIVINNPEANDIYISGWHNIDTFTFNLSGMDIENKPLTFIVQTQPQHGEILDNIYVPDKDYYGDDFFTYIADNGEFKSNPATVSIHQKKPFITTWKTDNDGNTTNTQIKIGTRPFDDNTSSDFYFPYTYNFIIDWGDDNIDKNVTGEIIHTYNNIGTYAIKISGDYPQPWFGNRNPQGNYNDYDGHKVIGLEQWGDIEWKSMLAAFMECRYMVVQTNDKPNLKYVTNMYRMFYRAGDFNQDISDWDVSKITDMGAMFKYAYNFNQDISQWDVSSVKNMAAMFKYAFDFNQSIGVWDVSSVEDMSYMFARARSFDQDIGSWNLESVTTLHRMFDSTTLSTINYDALLIGWSQFDLHENLSFHAGDSQYSVASSTSRDRLTNDLNWSIIDGGITE